MSEDSQAVQLLLELFFEQTQNKPTNDVYATALALESVNDRRAPSCSARAWLDTLFGSYCCVGARSASRRSNAARGRPCRKPPSHSPNVAGRETIAPLISALKQPSVRIRFWAVFASRPHLPWEHASCASVGVDVGRSRRSTG